MADFFGARWDPRRNLHTAQLKSCFAHSVDSGECVCEVWLYDDSASGPNVPRKNPFQTFMSQLLTERAWRAALRSAVSPQRYMQR